MSPVCATGDVDRFRAIISARLGLHFEDARLGFLGDVLGKRVAMARRGSSDYLFDLERRADGEGEYGELARELTVGESYFFRNREQFGAFAEIAVPDRLRECAASGQLRILSAGCASGEEAFSLAILLEEIAAARASEILITAIDINPLVLEKAACGRFSAWALRETPPAIRDRWFRPAGRDFLLDERIRAAVRFEQRNIAGDDHDVWRRDAYDIVFCRNVLMYFRPEIMRAVIARIAASLRPGGYLFLGHAESLRGLSERFDVLNSHGAFYYRRRADDGGAAAPAMRPVALSPAPATAGGAGNRSRFARDRCPRRRRAFCHRPRP